MGASVPEGFVFSKDGRYLYGSSFFTGVSNIYRYEIATGELAAVSNAEVGFFRPLPLDDTRLIVLRYAAKGFVPTLIEAKPTEDLSAVTFLGAQVAAKHPEVKGWVAATPSATSYESQIVAQGPYRPERNLSLESLIPVVEGFQDSVGIGARARFSDPLGLDWLALDSSYSPDEGLPSVTGRPVLRGIARTSTTSSGRPSAALQAITATSPTIAPSSTTRRRRWI